MNRTITGHTIPAKPSMPLRGRCRPTFFLAILTVSLVCLGEGDLAVAQTGINVRVKLTLPTPTGEHTIGIVSLHLIDSSRQDPFWSHAALSRAYNQRLVSC